MACTFACDQCGVTDAGDVCDDLPFHWHIPDGWWQKPGGSYILCSEECILAHAKAHGYKTKIVPLHKGVRQRAN